MTKHRGATVPSPQWWKHLRDWKRVFWKRDRKAQQQECGGVAALLRKKPNQ